MHYFFVHEVTFDPINRRNHNSYARKDLGEKGLQFWILLAILYNKLTWVYTVYA